ncbi:MAG TPA: glycosyltransferase family 10, partial [Gammaproteobacteria bacterium]|nr:glycosyltransferase family 10 [Gammaproteobacteria bacterium]
AWLKPYLEPYYNAHFRSYDYQYPNAGQDFVLGIEPHDTNVPQFILNIVKLAFPDRNVVISNDRQPHLILRSEHIKTALSNLPEYQHWNAPYISFSQEYWTLAKQRYRKNAPPLAELVSRKPRKKREFYFPFIAWCGLSPERIYIDNKTRTKFLAYIASNCIKKRDKLFSLIKSKKDSAEALGRCSNPNKTTFPGGWGKLDHVYAHYDFGFAMENHQVPGYITEKILNVFRGGAIPIYWGDSETVKSYFNPKAYIDVGAFDSLEEAADYIVRLSRDKETINNMRKEPIFKDNQVPEIFHINTDPNHPLLKQAAQFIRSEYNMLLEQDRSHKKSS